MNSRNGDVILPLNPRKSYPLVDDKVQTKKLALAARLPVPALYGLIESISQVKDFARIVQPYPEFVVKPARGSGGGGIVVVKGHGADGYQKANGRILTEAQIHFHIQNALGGAFSLGGGTDTVLIEYCIQNASVFAPISSYGIPDIRIIVFMGVPIMAMARLPTEMSDRRANLHQGAIGAGIDIGSGKTLNAIWRNQVVYKHPDTHQPVSGLQIPEWDKILTLSARSYELTGLGYIGVDIVLDRQYGPLLLELNARPGLSIQLANKAGLRPRIDRTRQSNESLTNVEQRVLFAKDNFATTSN